MIGEARGLTELQVVGSESGHVDQAYVLPLAGLDADRRRPTLVDQARVGVGHAAVEVGRGQVAVDQAGHLVAVPVGDGEDVLLRRVGLVLVLRVVDDQGRPQPVRVLAHVVRVVPEGAGRVRGELVGEGLARRDGTLRDTSATIHLGRALLPHAVPVNAGRLIAERVGDMCDDGVVDIDVERRRRPLPVDGDDGPRVAIRSGVDPADIPVDLDSLGQRRGRKAERKRKASHCGDFFFFLVS